MCWQMGKYAGERSPRISTKRIVLDTPPAGKKRLLSYKTQQIKAIHFLMTEVILYDTTEHGRKAKW